MSYGDTRYSESRAFSFEQFRGRLRIVMVVLGIAMVAVVARAAQLQLFDEGFLEGQGKARFTRVAKLAAHRGAILDRNGESLAVSTPVDTVWVNPREMQDAATQYPRLAEALNSDKQWVAQRISSNLDREFLYLKRHMRPADAAQVASLNLPGVNLQREYRRYYPAGEVASHLLGFTNIDDVGQEGLELAYDHLLGGKVGAKRVIRDLRGNTVEDIESIRPAQPGGDLITSIDLRIQYLAYRELKAAVAKHRAQSGTVVVVDVETGEVLAMVNQPSFNPNDREQLEARKYRNRAATDIFEPGSSIKPFVAAAAVATGRYHANTVIDISAGFMNVGIKRITDEHKVGAAPFSTIIAKSSNLGMTKVAMSLQREQMWQMFDAFGFGQITGSGFPGESAGMLAHHDRWKPIEQATMSYGYGLSVTPLQLAHAYAILGAGGISRPLSLRRVDTPIEGHRVIEESVARELLQMMERVVTEQGGTGSRAALVGYRVAGKTGTAKKAEHGGYSENRYVATFGGVVPASKPKLAAIVVIDDPGGDAYYGGELAAPVFSNVMAGALRLIGVPADNLDQLPPSRLLQASEDTPLEGELVGAGNSAGNKPSRPPIAARNSR
jgi:cell division protein FtsI (penicillin-binding protein 3)